MARQRSARVAQLKDHLLRQIAEGVFRAGERFPSARVVASDHSISYQTAHRLLDELRSEGHVVRRSASGTYVPGDAVMPSERTYSEVKLILSSRARRPNSFGARLLAGLAEQMRRKGIVWQIEWAEGMDYSPRTLTEDCLPVLWEAPQALSHCCKTNRRAVLLNARPLPGLESTGIDSVSLDDYFGGCSAADVVMKGLPASAPFLIISGPDDPRSNDRRDGFLSRARNSQVISAGGWYVEDGLRIAQRALSSPAAGIFCVNDRLAQAVLFTARQVGAKRPRVIGFDNAPVAAELNLTTIAIPWNELVGDAAQIIHRRLTGDSSAARRQLITPQIVLRDL